MSTLGSPRHPAHRTGPAQYPVHDSNVCLSPEKQVSYPLDERGEVGESIALSPVTADRIVRIRSPGERRSSHGHGHTHACAYVDLSVETL